MVIDSSALLAILLNEPERRSFNERIEADGAPRVSAASVVETGIVLINRFGDDAGLDLDALLQVASIEIVPVDAEQAQIARDAFRRYGKGRHPAGLNFGDCFAYALAAVTGEPLLYKGDDFAKTDVASA